MRRREIETATPHERSPFVNVRWAKKAGEEMTPTLKDPLDSPAVNVFLGTAPLLASIIWGLLQNDRRLQALDKRMDLVDKRIDSVDQRLGRLETRIDSIDMRLTVVSERLVKVETCLKGGPVVLSHR